MAGKVKVTKSLLNVVRVDEPNEAEEAQAKMAMHRVTPTRALGYTDQTMHGGQARPNPAVRDLTQRGKPDAPPRAIAAGWPARGLMG
jgi:hypothetical protein